MDNIIVSVERYKISDGRNTIFMSHCGANKIMITPGDKPEKNTFNFTLSKPETITAIANLMLKAVDVAEKGLAKCI